MFIAIEPIYRTLCETFQARFARSRFTHDNADKFRLFEGEGDDTFKELDIGLRTLNRKNITPDIVPYAAIEWGATSDVKPFRMPESYEYSLTVPLVLITGFGTMTDAQMHLVFRPVDVEGNFRDDYLNPGIGELVGAVGDFFWREYHTGRFLESLIPNPPVNLDVDVLGENSTITFDAPIQEEGALQVKHYQYRVSVGKGQWITMEKDNPDYPNMDEPERIPITVDDSFDFPTPEVSVDKPVNVSVRSVDMFGNWSVPISAVLKKRTKTGPVEVTVRKTDVWNYSILDFTQLIHNPYLVSSTVDTPLLQHLREITASGAYRAAQIDFVFQIEERKITL